MKKTLLIFILIYLYIKYISRKKEDSNKDDKAKTYLTLSDRKPINTNDLLQSQDTIQKVYVTEGLNYNPSKDAIKAINLVYFNNDNTEAFYTKLSKILPRLSKFLIDQEFKYNSNFNRIDNNFFDKIILSINQSNNLFSESKAKVQNTICTKFNSPLLYKDPTLIYNLIKGLDV